MHAVGAKGQVVIEKGIRDRLGVGAGWQTVQTLVDDHVEIRFVPPEHDRSLFGALAQYAVRTPDDAEMDRVVAEAVAGDFRGEGDGDRV